MRSIKVVSCLPITVNIDLRQCAIVKSDVMQSDDVFLLPHLRPPVSSISQLPQHTRASKSERTASRASSNVRFLVDVRTACERQWCVQTPLMNQQQKDLQNIWEDNIELKESWEIWKRDESGDLLEITAIIFKSRDSRATTIVKTKLNLIAR